MARIRGTSRSDRLVGTNARDFIFGLAAADVLLGLGGPDVLRGGTGNDTVKGASGNDKLYGDSGKDTLRGGTGNDKLWGGTSHDKLYGDSGKDTLRGGGGNDTLRGGTSHDKLFGDAGADKLLGDSGNDTLNGGGGNDNLNGGTGHDILIGATGNDTLNGGTGNDLLLGGAGGDLLIGGDGVDTASYAGSAEAVTISLSIALTNGGDATGDTLMGIENLIGSDLNDLLIGDDANNTLVGGLGDDTLTGGNGDDVLIGGPGGDTLNGSADVDTASYAGSPSAVSVSLRTGVVSGGDAAGDTLTGIENLIGSNFDDFLEGSTGFVDNRLEGGAGDDILIGFFGIDVLAGGSDSDRFIFDNNDPTPFIIHTGIGEGNRDIVLDFSQAELDLVDISGLNLSTLQFISTNNFSGTAPEIRYFQSGGNTIVQGTLNADAVVDFEIEFAGLINFAEGDFVLV